MPASQLLVLTEDERAHLQDISSGDNSAEARRAKIILLSAEGQDSGDIAAAVDSSKRTVQRWQREFESSRMGIFNPEAVSLPEETEPTTNGHTASPAEPESRSEEFDSPGPRVRIELRDRPGVELDQPMSEAARRVLHFHFGQMLQHEPGSRAGDDLEAVHDTRVAIRRMRSAFRIFGPYFRRKAIQRHMDGLRQTARALGPVRDLDVFRENLARYQQDHPAASDDALAALLNDWAARCKAARKKLIRHLDSKTFGNFVANFTAFLTTDDAGAKGIAAHRPEPYQVQHVAPGLIYARYEAMRAYEPLLHNAPAPTLHALRIEGKRFRYTLEFLAEVLGPEVKQVIEAAKTLQDHLGNLNDAEVATHYLRDFINTYECGQRSASKANEYSIAQVAQYMAYQMETRHRLLETFPEVWAAFTSASIREALALSIARL